MDTDIARETVAPTLTVDAGNNGGGVCSYHRNGRFDPVFIQVFMISLLYLGVRNRGSSVCPPIRADAAF